MFMLLFLAESIICHWPLVLMKYIFYTIFCQTHWPNWLLVTSQHNQNDMHSKVWPCSFYRRNHILVYMYKGNRSQMTRGNTNHLSKISLQWQIWTRTIILLAPLFIETIKGNYQHIPCSINSVLNISLCTAFEQICAK